MSSQRIFEARMILGGRLGCIVKHPSGGFRGDLGGNEEEGQCDCALLAGAGGPSRATAQSISELDFLRGACHAAQVGDLTRLAAILERHPAAMHGEESAGSTAQQQKQRQGQQGERGADSSASSSGSNYTPLHYAARAGKIDAVNK